MHLKKLFVNMGFLGVFIFGIMTFVLVTQVDNDVTYTITNNTFINNTYGSLSGNLSISEEKLQVATGNFDNNTQIAGGGELDVIPVVSQGRITKTIIIGLWNIYIQMPQVIFGVSPIVAGFISSVLLLFLILGVWAIWKGVVGT